MQHAIAADACVEHGDARGGQLDCSRSARRFGQRWFMSAVEPKPSVTSPIARRELLLSAIGRVVGARANGKRHPPLPGFVSCERRLQEKRTALRR